ncbi:MAG: hypothetical protein MZW92_12055 [Comamonadaceae bacterium]|nr:hypothetical protein [Comamonadaceae bacterium]
MPPPLIGGRSPTLRRAASRASP